MDTPEVRIPKPLQEVHIAKALRPVYTVAIRFSSPTRAKVEPDQSQPGRCDSIRGRLPSSVAAPPVPETDQALETCMRTLSTTALSIHRTDGGWLPVVNRRCRIPGATRGGHSEWRRPYADIQWTEGVRLGPWHAADAVGSRYRRCGNGRLTLIR